MNEKIVQAAADIQNILEKYDLNLNVEVSNLGTFGGLFLVNCKDRETVDFEQASLEAQKRGLIIVSINES